MSFGFGVGDFINIADKAWTVYRKCRDAPDQYKQLASNVDMLRQVLDDTQAFLANEELPDSQCKTNSLISAGHNCLAALQEVDEFLDKHSRLGCKTKRIIDTMRFITSDVQGLQSKLELNTQLLQLCFLSIQSMSIAVIKTNLGKITKEYQNGTREPSALSSVFESPNSAAAEAAADMEDDLYSQLITDLEGTDIHPDCIALHRGYIKAWLHDVVTDGPEGPVLESVGLGVAHELAPHFRLKTVDMRKPSLQDLSATPVTDRSSVDNSHASSLFTPFDELASDAPTDQPDSELVKQLLSALFLLDPFEQYVADDAQPRLQRAFERLDYTQRGSLTRSEILKASHAALEYAGVSSDKQASLDLPSLLSTFDIALSGQYDETMFISFMHHLVQICFEARKEQLSETLSRNAMLARSFLRRPPDDLTGLKAVGMANRRRAVPFGWSSRSLGSGILFYHDITGHERQQLPDIPAHSFTQMATEAAWAVDLLETLQSECLSCAPRATRGQFLDVFDTLRNAAVKYTIYEAHGRPFELSDLDNLLYSCRIITKLDPQFLSVRVRDVVRELEYIRKWSYASLETIVGFVWSVSGILQAKATAANYFSVLSSAWRISQAPVVSRRVRDDSKKWNIVVDATKRGRNVITPLLYEHAISLARTEVIERSSRQISLTALRVSGFKRPKAWILKYYFGRATVAVDTPAQLHNLKLDKLSNTYSWAEHLTINMRKSSKVTIAFYLDSVGSQSDKPHCSATFAAVDYGILRVEGNTVRKVEKPLSLPLSDGGIASIKLRCDSGHDFIYAMELSIIDDLLGAST